MCEACRLSRLSDRRICYLAVLEKCPGQQLHLLFLATRRGSNKKARDSPHRGSWWPRTPCSRTGVSTGSSSARTLRHSRSRSSCDVVAWAWCRCVLGGGARARRAGERCDESAREKFEVRPQTAVRCNDNRAVSVESRAATVAHLLIPLRQLIQKSPIVLYSPAWPRFTRVVRLSHFREPRLSPLHLRTTAVHHQNHLLYRRNHAKGHPADGNGQAPGRAQGTEGQRDG